MKRDAMVIRLYNKGLTDREIGLKLGVTHQRVSQIRKRLGLTAKATQLRQNKKALHEQGLTDKEISEIVGIKRSSVCYWRKRFNLPRNLKKEEFPQRYLLWQQGFSDVQIAEMEGVGQTAIHSWRTRRGLPTRFLSYADNHVSMGSYYPELQRECLRIETYETQGANLL